MKTIQLKKMATAGLMVTLGLILPYATSHMFGMPGTVLLPMHLPVLLCGLLCGAKFGALCGLLVPLLSSALTGMPPVYPMLPIMAAQLVVLGLLGGLLYHKMRLHILLSITLAVLGGWLMYGLVLGGLLLATPGTKALSVGSALLAGIPGLVLQLVACPLLVTAIARARGTHAPKPAIDKKIRSGVLDEARQLIQEGQADCVIIHDGKIVSTGKGRGIAPLLSIYHNTPELLRGALVVDKIIGKAAAMILVLGGAKSAHGLVMSAAARAYLQKYKVVAGNDRCVDMITARTGAGICPIEQSVLAIDNPASGLAAMEQRLGELRHAAG